VTSIFSYHTGPRRQGHAPPCDLTSSIHPLTHPKSDLNHPISVDRGRKRSIQPFRQLSQCNQHCMQKIGQGPHPAQSSQPI